MRHISRSLLTGLWMLPFVVLSTPPAMAQQDCNQCTPYSSCDEYCGSCVVLGRDGCEQYEDSTCGESRGACMQCTPNYVETSRELRGTYGNGSMFSCSHHKVEWVTRHDVNECNTSSYYWTVSTCEDTLDGGKSGWFPDCCDGYGPGGVLNSTYTCNHQHNC